MTMKREIMVKFKGSSTSANLWRFLFPKFLTILKLFSLSGSICQKMYKIDDVDNEEKDNDLQGHWNIHQGTRSCRSPRKVHSLLVFEI